MINIIDSEEKTKFEKNKEQKKINNEKKISVQKRKNLESKQNKNIFQKILNFFNN